MLGWIVGIVAGTWVLSKVAKKKEGGGGIPPIPPRPPAPDVQDEIVEEGDRRGLPYKIYESVPLEGFGKAYYALVYAPRIDDHDPMKEWSWLWYEVPDEPFDSLKIARQKTYDYADQIIEREGW